MQLTFFDSSSSLKKMLPLSYTRPIAELRVGILKIHEKWQKTLKPDEISFRTEAYLQNLFRPPICKTLTVQGNVLPSKTLIKAINELSEDEVITCMGELVAGYYEADEEFIISERNPVEIQEINQVSFPWDIFMKNGAEIKRDFELLTEGRKSAELKDEHTKTYGTDIFIEKNAKIKAAVLNAESGPIYIGNEAEIQEGALIRGPFSLGDHSVINMGAKMRGDTTIGPYSKVGGEISNSVIQGYSNKGHEGFLGNSVLGEWCNLGADTNNSNLKNNYANVKMWDFEGGQFKDTGLQFCGLVMGDHSKSGINTMFNTGTTVGVSANIFGEGFPRNIIPSFSWGGSSGFSTYQLRKAFETAELVLSRRGKILTEEDKAVLSHIFEITSENRVWDKQ